ncbi:MAG: putative permease, superfamily [Pseudonocardiales bacterium]|nr:putative permease, superfamily [Pseudonocardiales bacterium]
MTSREADVPQGVGLAVTSVASVQFGAATAAHLFPLVGPIGTVTLRLTMAAIVLTVMTRPWRADWTRRSFGASAVFALVFVVMNVSLYLALDRLPLATVITLEFLGPLGVSIATARSWRERIWALPAGAGVAFLGGTLTTADLAGVGFALTAAIGWAAYILVSGRVGRTGTGLAGLSVAGTLGALIMLPIGITTAGSALWEPSTLAVGLAVGVLSSAIPYSFDLLALRRLPTAVFGVLTSLNPAVAALAGFLVLDERLPGRQLFGIALVMIASAGISVTAARDSRRSARRPVQRSAGQDVRVDVEDTLARLSPGVEDRPKLADA